MRAAFALGCGAVLGFSAVAFAAFGAFVLFVSAVSTPLPRAALPPERVEQPARVTAVDMALARVDARRNASPEPFAATASESLSTAPKTRQRGASEPERRGSLVGADRQTAVEADVDGSRAYVIKPAGSRVPPRWEVRSLVERCSRRPTQWVREKCMAGD